MIKYLLLGFFSITSLVNSQERPIPIYLEHNSILKDSVQTEVFSYRIPYKNLLFIKEGDEYKASFVLTLEFYKGKDFIKREIVNPTLAAADYETTLSGAKNYQNWLSITLKPGEYILEPILSLGSTELEYKIPAQKIEVDSLTNKGIIGPIVVNSSSPGKDSFILSNNGNSIPYSPERYSLLYGIADSIADTLNVEITQTGREVFNGSFVSNHNGDLFLNKVGDDIILNIEGNTGFSYFQISGFSHLLYEGKSELKIEYNGIEHNYDLKTSWMQKPNILNNPEYSIKLLIYIEEEDVVGDLLSLDDDDYYKGLTEYWIENYPADGMKYNYAMEEYYSRADHAVKNFSSLNAFDGAERDRGKIYILYGEPTEINRNYNEMNEIVEVWNYENLGKNFVFKDVNGTGKFDLAE